MARVRAAGGGCGGLVGVQSNQFPRALDLGRQFRDAGVAVIMGGFHVSGCLSMLPETPPELAEAQALGITLFAGEAEGGRIAELLRDIDRGTAKPVYNYLADLPDLDAATFPVLPREIVTRVIGHYASFDAGRGCPFQCSFCTIINVQGRKSRFRTADDVEAIVRANVARRITHFFVTDDNFARKPELGADPRPPDRVARGGAEDPTAAAGRHAVPPHARLHREMRKSRLLYRVHRTREHQSAIVDGDQEASEQDLGISRDATGVEARQCHDLGRLYPRIPKRHTGFDRARYRDHPAGIADRHPRILLPDATAGVGGSQDAVNAWRRDGCRSQQIRPRTLHHGSRQDEPRGVGGDLSRLLEPLLHRRACRNDPAPCRRDRAEGAPGRGRVDRFFRSAADRGRAPRCNSACPGARSEPSGGPRSGARARCCSIRAGGSTPRWRQVDG